MKYLVIERIVRPQANYPDVIRDVRTKIEFVAGSGIFPGQIINEGRWVIIAIGKEHQGIIVPTTTTLSPIRRVPGCAVVVGQRISTCVIRPEITLPEGIIPMIGGPFVYYLYTAVVVPYKIIMMNDVISGVLFNVHTREDII